MIAADDPFAPFLHEFLDINYNIDSYNYDRNHKPSHPLNFHDRHIDGALRLKTIVKAPWIPTALRQVCADPIKEFTSAGHTFEYNASYRKITVTNQPLNFFDSDGVAGHFKILMLGRCFGFASKLLFSPKDRQWPPFLSLLSFGRDIMTGTLFKSCYTSLEVPEDSDSDEWTQFIPPETRSGLADWVIPTFRAIGSEKSFVNYEFYGNTYAGEDLMKKIGPCAEFNWEAPTTVGAETPPSMFSQSHNSAVLNRLFPELASSKPCTQKPPEKVKKRRVIPPIERTPEHCERSYNVNVNHFIQMAWINAIERDASFIVFHCGRYNLIGIRHRETQTLYLSDLIDTTCEKGYGQMHLGLFIAGIKDRLAQVDLNEAPKGLKRKRPLKERPTVLNSMKDKATRRKRQKLNPNPEVIKLEKQRFDNELGKRDLALLHLCFDTYHSPAPSSFRRMEPSCVAQPFSSRSYLFKQKRMYPPDSYITVIANAEVGEGAVGVVYRVSVDIETSTGEKQQRNMIMKLAIGQKKDKLIQEYKAYQKLAQAGVTHGIVGVHGLFHDMETGAMMILMDDAGMTLRDRALAYGESVDDTVETSNEEFDAYVEVLQGIHSANISHGDIRIDNLMINDQGEVFIIDFDCMENRRSMEDIYQLAECTRWFEVLHYL